MLRKETKENSVIENKSISKIALDQAMDVIKSLNGFAKIISVTPDSDKYLNFILAQLLNPKTNRPIKPMEKVDRHRIYDPRKGEWIDRKVEDDKRGRNKNTVFTKKTAVTLFPSDGIINLYMPKHGYPAGLIFDAKKCHLKNEKYIFLKNATTNTKWWIKKKGISELKQPVTKGVTLSILQEHLIKLRSNRVVPEWNEILAGLSSESLVAVFAVNTTIADRLRALYTQQKIKVNFHLHLPILLITASQGITVYDEYWQDHDYRTAFKMNSPFAFIQQLNPVRSSLTKDVQYRSDFGFDFLTDGLMPSSLKLIILAYLNFPDLIKIQTLLRDSKVNEPLTRHVNKVVEEVKAHDLSDILSNQPIDSLQVDSVLAQCMFVYDYFIHSEPVLQIFRKFVNSWFGVRRQEFMNVRFEFVERVLAHICHANLKDIIIDVLKRVTYEHNKDLLHLILSMGVNPIIRFEDWELFYDVVAVADFRVISHFIPQITNYESLKRTVTVRVKSYYDDESWDYDIEKYKIIFSPILIAALSNKVDTLQLLSQYFPNELLEAISSLREIDCADDQEEVKEKLAPYEKYLNNKSNAKVLLLLQLNSTYHAKYHLDYDEKRLVESYLIKEIEKLNSPAEISTFWKKHKDALYLTQLRYRFFWDKPDKMTTIKENVYQKLQGRLNELESSRNIQPEDYIRRSL